MNNETARTTFDRTKEYDPQFATALAGEIMGAIAEASRLTDQPLIAFRTAETAEALICCLITTLSVIPDLRTPSRLREWTEGIAKRIRRDVARAQTSNFATEVMAAGKVHGHA
jgi:hypothetical protein